MPTCIPKKRAKTGHFQCHYATCTPLYFCLCLDFLQGRGVQKYIGNVFFKKISKNLSRAFGQCLEPRAIRFPRRFLTSCWYSMLKRAFRDAFPAGGSPSSYPNPLHFRPISPTKNIPTSPLNFFQGQRSIFPGGEISNTGTIIPVRFGPFLL